MIIIGDTHGIKPVFDIIDKSNITDSNIIHVGDLGLGFQPKKWDVANLYIIEEMLNDTKNKLYVVRGNHDNPEFWDQSKIFNKELKRLKLVEDYSLLEIEDRNVFFCGGATSIDRCQRKREDPPTWWEYEEFNLIVRHINNLDKRLIDTVITHNSPAFCYPHESVISHLVTSWARKEIRLDGTDLIHDLKTERVRLTLLYKYLKTHNERILPRYRIQNWFYGHFHKSYVEENDGTEFRAMAINEVKET